MIRFAWTRDVFGRVSHLLLPFTENRDCVSVISILSYMLAHRKTWSSVQWDPHKTLLSLSRLHSSPFFSLAALPSVVLVLAGVWHQLTPEWKHEFDSCHKHALSNSLTMKPFNDPGTVSAQDGKHIFIAFFFFSSYKSGGRGRCYDGTHLCGVVFVPPSPRGVKARRGTSRRREKGCVECSNRWDESSVLVRYALSFFLPLSPSLFPLLSFSFSLFRVLISIYPTFPVSHFIFSLSSVASFDFISISSPVFCLLPSTSLPPSSFLPCSWHVAQNHINTVLPITHTRVQKAERARYRAVKNRLSTVTCLHAEKWAAFLPVSAFFPFSDCKILTKCDDCVPLKSRCAPLTQFPV